MITFPKFIWGGEVSRSFPEYEEIKQDICTGKWKVLLCSFLIGPRLSVERPNHAHEILVGGKPFSAQKSIYQV